ncbi:amidohydrolase [Pontibacter silvestris]|uniref:Amidohydrolase n=1 Tax=Pontibacter silvestris TaxID=2305183 RepID=A0ABW4X1X9_9BACT|nr:amidohydrolase [Pontibacter silvestris]MCC9138682.1 amidohydrolase [Pontibacter silvestris]
MNIKTTLLSILCCLSLSVIAQNNPDKEKILASLDKETASYAGVAKKIWEYAEPGYLEDKSSALLQERLKKAGFKITPGVAEIPTAFVATYGSGEPVIGILAEYDALPGLSQVDAPEKKAAVAGAAGHGCGHNLFGTGSVAAAVAVKDWLKNSGTKGTIKVFGTPAEEGGSGKVYMVRAGLFNDVDAVLHWHPADRNLANASSSLANKSGKFRFHGASSHAAAAPERGRSALDGVEAMNNMVNMMREHVSSDTRIHYVITKGGEAPNVVPAFAEVYYYVRHPEMDEVKETWERVVKAAEGAALGTGTTMEYEITGGVYNTLPNEVLSKLMHANLSVVGGVDYTEEEKTFANKIQTSFIADKPALESAQEIQPFRVEKIRAGGGGSTDVGDVSWTVPTAGLRTATFVPGTPGHSWQAVAAGGTSIGTKGMMVAAKAMALTAYDIFKNPAVVKEAETELVQKQGNAFKYEALLGNRKPALDYRK